MPSVGDMAPDFTLTAQDKSSVTLSEMRGSRVILAFYPAAFTGVCTKEMCTFSEGMSSLNSSGVSVFGISVDSPFSNAAFADANGISFPLLSDVHREAIESYGVSLADFVISGYTVAQRSVFVIEADGRVGYSWVAENPGIEPDYEAVMAHCA
ncbi:MAG: peroxiredoxin [Candidatus Thermoplasmatota archaeon]|jgi:peroxiredoxin|nr:peroxiredoxin [Euryarchaeota archaeon]MAN00156.1 peroxiredoxin [Euryarchaeota archaeon]MBO53431.1 peroxiredoxin [Euryarchaeota archaeon]MED5452367.1 peroxiredoxin [Candidatus Thermoplasmatota archaeon]|tara:strand:+ start:24314 stop:24772 length:459 start_codon:yes stop_codon:yes gene_type:complete